MQEIILFTSLAGLIWFILSSCDYTDPFHFIWMTNMVHMIYIILVRLYWLYYYFVCYFHIYITLKVCVRYTTKLLILDYTRRIYLIYSILKGIHIFSFQPSAILIVKMNVKIRDYPLVVTRCLGHMWSQDNSFASINHKKINKI